MAFEFQCNKESTANAAQARILDAVLVTLMEHGITPSAIASRLINDSCPEAIQAAVGIPREVARGIAVVSRAAGLVGHIREERLDPSARHIWDTVAAAVPYSGK